MEPDRIVITGARQHNLAQRHRRDPEEEARGADGRLGLRQVLARLRHPLRRGPAPLHREPLRLRPAVPRADGEAALRLDQGPRAHDLDRAEGGELEPPLDRRHGHRDPRLPARAVGPGGPAHLPPLRPAGLAAVGAADRPRGPAAPGGDEVPRPRPARQGEEGRAPRRHRAGREVRLHPRPRGRHRALPRGRDPPRQEEEALDRRGRGPPGREAGAHPAPHRLGGDGAQARPGHRDRGRRGPARPGPLRAPRLPPLRHLLPGADAAAVLVQLAPGHVPRVLRPRHPHGDGPPPRGPEPRPLGERGRGEAARGGRRGDHVGQRHRAGGRARARDRPQQAVEVALRRSTGG